MSYEYDVFISYKRSQKTRACLTGWIERVGDIVAYWVSLEVGRDVDVFFDSQSIEIGSEWPTTLREALARSRSLLCFWTPEYFRSGWCVAELSSFEQRELGHQDLRHPLIVPVCLGGRTHFPAHANRRQMMDLSPYAQTLDSFWNTGRAAELELELQSLARSLGLSIANAPLYDTDWPEPDADPAVQLQVVALQRI